MILNLVLWAALAATVPAPSVDNANGTSAPTDAQGTPAELEDDAISASNLWGSRGIHRVDAAHGVRAKSLVLSLGAEYARATSLFEDNDKEVYNAERLHILFSPVEGLELGFSEALILNDYRNFVPASLQVLGSPRIHGKYTMSPKPGVGIGGRLTLTLPSALYSAGVVARAAVIQLDALGSYRLSENSEVSANLGVIIDGSHRLTDQPVSSLPADKRLVYQVNQGNGVNLAVGALRQFFVRRNTALTPFAEITARLNGLKSFSENPVLLTVGAKVYGVEQHLLELSVGVDLRLSGKPKVDSTYPGLTPWTAFAVLSAHLFDHPPPRMLAAIACDGDSDCADGQKCREGFCRYTTEVIHETVKQVKQDTFTVTGSVSDVDSKAPVDEAIVTFSGFENTPVAVDRKSGKYVSFPLDTGEGLLRMKVKAPNYKPFETTISRGKANDVTYVDVKMARSDRPDAGIISGTVLDGRTGRLVARAKVSIPSIGVGVTVDSKGKFTSRVKAGRHEVLISAPGYATQRKHVVVRDGDTVILNVDLIKEHRGNLQR